MSDGSATDCNFCEMNDTDQTGVAKFHLVCLTE